MLVHMPGHQSDGGGDGGGAVRDPEAAGVEWFGEDFEGDDPVAFVIDANIHRRHLDESQRGMVAAKLANMPLGGASYRSANLPTDAVSQAAAAKMLNVSTRTVTTAAAVRTTGTPEWVRAVEQGAITVSVGAKIAKMEPDQQRQILVNSETAAGEVKKAERALREQYCNSRWGACSPSPSYVQPLSLRRRTRQEAIIFSDIVRQFLLIGRSASCDIVVPGLGVPQRVIVVRQKTSLNRVDFCVLRRHCDWV